MATTCATSQFTTTGGILGLDRSAMTRVVARSTVESTGDGDHGAQAPQSVEPAGDFPKVSHSLKTMIDQRVHWKNDYGVPVTVQAQIQRARRTIYISAPNWSFIRERHTQRVGTDRLTNVLAPDPDPTTIWDTEVGGGIDNGIWQDGEVWKPKYGQFRMSWPESTLTKEPMRVGPNESIDVRFRASLITPYRWWQPELIEDFHARAEAFRNTILLIAFPEVV